ncbi:hypothetical protein SDC9_126265 [bioreactor metagenome]|uniref:Uncharacterized protein n=1 Tax=bioreactor metagenome TaxID=1076179 RepID=A0A645CR91_9ZZZZ
MTHAGRMGGHSVPEQGRHFRFVAAEFVFGDHAEDMAVAAGDHRAGQLLGAHFRLAEGYRGIAAEQQQPLSMNFFRRLAGAGQPVPEAVGRMAQELDRAVDEGHFRRRRERAGHHPDLPVDDIPDRGIAGSRRHQAVVGRHAAQPERFVVDILPQKNPVDHAGRNRTQQNQRDYEVDARHLRHDQGAGQHPAAGAADARSHSRQNQQRYRNIRPRQESDQNPGVESAQNSAGEDQR